MKKPGILCLLFMFSFGISFSQETVTFKVLQTSDIHGNYFPYNFIEDEAMPGSLSRVYTYVKQEREKYGDRLILLDNGDILQGQPTAYYYNFVDTTSMHLCAHIMNYMGYDAATVGNHDIEAGHAVYDRVERESNFPWMAANALRNDTNTSYFASRLLYEADGVTIGVLGLITPAIPTWLPETLWSGMHFADAKKVAKEYVPELKEFEGFDVLLGLFHLGYDSRIVAGGIEEGGGENIAIEVPGLDAIMLGHDHRPVNRMVENVAGDSVLIINPGANGNYLSEITITLTKKNDKWESSVSGKLIDINDYEPSEEFIEEFGDEYLRVYGFVREEIAYNHATMRSREAYFGPSSFVDLIHRIQFDLTDADVSFAAPLSFDTDIAEGPIYVSDMFKLYKYENFLYTMRLTGREIKDFLEHSYKIWTNEMQSPADHLLDIQPNSRGNGYRFRNSSYNFDSAAGISYTVDVTKPAGKKISINPVMANGKAFDMNAEYLVAINSYRGNGGGGHLTEGAGIAPDKLNERIVVSTPVDLRYYMMQWMKKEADIYPEIITDWKFVPEEWTTLAAGRDFKLLFGEKN